MRSFQRLHRGEENDFPNGVGVGQQHDAAVDADSKAAGGGQAVLQGVDIVLVHHASLAVALGPQLHLLLEPLLLVDRVIQLGEGVAHLAAADEQLEPLRQPGIDLISIQSHVFGM